MVKSRKTIRKKVRHRGGYYGPFQTPVLAGPIYDRRRASKMNFPRMKRLLNYLSRWPNAKRFFGYNKITSNSDSSDLPENSDESSHSLRRGYSHDHLADERSGQKRKKKDKKSKHKKHKHNKTKHKKSKDIKRKSRSR